MAQFGEKMMAKAAEWVHIRYGDVKPITQDDLETAFLAGVLVGIEHSTTTLNEAADAVVQASIKS